MKIITTDYYRRFQCIAAQCSDSCCKEWTVDVDADSARFYRGLEGPLGDRLRHVLQDTPDGTHMIIENCRCPMWRQDGLCEIQAQLGHGALCVTCREFPRLRHDYGDFVELDLELSCPEAARMMFAGPPLLQVAEQPGGDASAYDEQTMTILRRSRETVSALLSQEQIPLAQGLAIMLLYAHQVQGEIDGADPLPFDAQECLEAAARYAGCGQLQPLADFFSRLEILTEPWRQALASTTSARCVSDKLRPLALYCVRRYWLQAISDLDLICRAKFAVAACALLSAMDGDPCRVSQLFSKEIENDPDNVDAIFDAAYTHEAFTDANLLGLLLNPEKVAKSS